MITGALDINVHSHDDEKMTELENSGSVILTDFTECAHIIGQPTNCDLKDPDKKVNFKFLVIVNFLMRR